MKLIVLLFLLTNVMNCLTVKRYINNRSRDATDILNLGIETNTYGVYASVPFSGLIGTRASGGKGFGLRHGHFGFYRTGDNENSITAETKTGNEMFSLDLGNSVPSWWSNYHEPMGNVHFRNQKKKYKYIYMYKCYGRYSVYYKGDKFQCGIIEIPFNPVYTIEISAGLYLGFRTGISFNEFFDFLVGFVGFDPMDDDISNDEPIYREFPLPLTEKKDWESKVDALDEKMDKRLTK